MDRSDGTRRGATHGAKTLARRLLVALGLRKPKPPRSFSLSARREAEARERFKLLTWPESKQGRILYGLVPTAELKNVGDQAQVVAIRRWLSIYYPGMPVVELDKDVVIACIDLIAAEMTKDDIVFLHSGGNLGDRGLWSETARRLIIEHLPRTRIVSLPQTIFFSDTPEGQRQRAISERIYNGHFDLTVLGRDKVSGELAEAMFPSTKVNTCPDFVLSLDAKDFGVRSFQGDSKVLACLRLDDESMMNPDMRTRIAQGLGREVTEYDTTLSQPIPADGREAILAETLQLFAAHGAVITDRFHGLIFAVLCKKPTVVLRTVDHKLTSALEWFSDIPNVQYCSSIDELPTLLSKVEAIPPFEYPDFNFLHFRRLADWLHAPGLRKR